MLRAITVNMINSEEVSLACCSYGVVVSSVKIFESFWVVLLGLYLFG